MRLCSIVLQTISYPVSAEKKVGRRAFPSDSRTNGCLSIHGTTPAPECVAPPVSLHGKGRLGRLGSPIEGPQGAETPLSRGG